ncbi:transcriptional regulator [Lachnoclostridium sp. An169]|uniref:helix-turn-helix domain-containing protein n=1 Tax=Lachnoclostridium sp. An169 TaxID=1965569 RepID=UPI000B54BE65|nr:helix-turn-helix transcriptional regulator [Lachnoclostridium sp. An169]OUP84205.1 transcriptional regulator [Lachnoclostridium sp. An169]
MDVLDRITQLRLERNWTEYQLAENSDLTQSTISSWYRKNMLPTIPSLIRLCDAFGITLSQFFLEDGENDVKITITEQQRRLLQYAARLDPNQYSALLNFLETL